MKVLIDTSIWSLVLRRKTGSTSIINNAEKNELKELINESRVAIIGPIRQEILSGISNDKQFKILKEKLQAFEDIAIQQLHYELAAEYYNRCRKKGIQGSHTDFLICAVANQNNLSIYTNDNDFKQYSKLLEIQLYEPRKIVPYQNK